MGRFKWEIRIASEEDGAEWSEWFRVGMSGGWWKKSDDADTYDAKKLAKLLMKEYDTTNMDMIDPIPPKVVQAMGDENHGFAWIFDSGQGGGHTLVEWQAGKGVLNRE